MTEDERKRRNYVIAGTVGGFLLPLAGLIGALAFYMRHDVAAASYVGIASLAGVVAYVILFSA